MPPILVRLNLPGFSSPEPFRLASAPPSMTGLACAVLEEIGGFSKEELDGVRNNLDTVPLTFLGELCAGQLVPLASDAELGVFLATAESPHEPAILEVRPQGAEVGSLEEGGSPSPAKPAASAAPASTWDTAAPAMLGAVGQQAGGGAAQRGGPAGNGVLAAPLPSSGVSRVAPPAAAPSLDATGRLESNGRGFEQVAEPQPAAPQPAPQPQLPCDQFAPPARPRKPEAQHSQKSRGSSRASTPPCERRPPSEGDAGARSRGGRVDPSASGAHPDQQGSFGHAAERQPSRETPVYMRLYQEKDDRRRRLEEARLRKIEQEEDDIRAAAKRALGRAPSPGRAASPSGRASSPAPTSRAGARTPPRMRPPLPQSLPPRHGHRSRDRAVGSGEPPANRRASHGHAQETESSAALSPMAASPGPSGPQDASSIASEGACGLQSCGSVGTLIGEDSLCGDAGSTTAAGSADDVQGLRHLLTTQQQRVQVLEGMHQQALKQLRKSREELARAHQQRFHEADRVLRLEQLFSEMQAQRFDGDMQAQLRWEQWLLRSRAIFEEEPA